MGRRGRLPDPNSQRSRAAVARARQIGAVAGQADAFVPQDVPRPAVLERLPLASAFWDRVAPILIADGRLTPDRADSFALLCQLHAESQQLAEQVAAEGWITATDKSQAASPVAKLLRDSRRDFVTLARDFGLTAAAAARIPQETISGEVEEDEESAVLAELSVRGA